MHNGTVDSNIATVNITINAVNDPPIVTLSANPISSIAPLLVDFTANAYDTDGVITIYEWDLNGDGTFEITDTTSTVSYTYSSPGTYKAKVQVTDNNGAQAVSNAIDITVSAATQIASHSKSSKKKCFITIVKSDKSELWCPADKLFNKN